MGWGIVIITLILGGIYSGIRDCLLELKKISMHSRASEEAAKCTNSNVLMLQLDLQKMDERLLNIETAANLAWDRMMRLEYPAEQQK